MPLFRKKKNEALLKSESFTTFVECNQKILLEPLLGGNVKMSGEGFMLFHCIQVGCSEQLWAGISRTTGLTTIWSWTLVGLTPN